MNPFLIVGLISFILGQMSLFGFAYFDSIHCWAGPPCFVMIWVYGFISFMATTIGIHES